MTDTRVDPPIAPLAAPPPPSRPAVDPALGGPLRIAPVGVVVAVATDALLTHADRLSWLRDTLSADALALSRLHPPSADQLASAPPGAVHAVREVAAAHVLTRAAAEIAADADVALRRAVDAYADNEARQRERALALGAGAAIAIGPIIRTLVAWGLPAIAAAGLAGTPSTAQLAALQRWMLDHPESITSPAFVETVRVAVMSMDDAAGSVLGLPPGMAGGIAAAGGFAGVQAGAAWVLAGARPFGLFREGPVSVDRVSSTGVSSAPSGAAERLARVPEGDQVRIERYDAPGAPPRFVVYVGPTETFSPVATGEPWDLTSNVQAVAGLDGGSMRATRAAMLDAGIRPSDAVQLVGFSQGGLVAARIAASGEWNVAGLETYGAPAGNIELPAGLAGMAVRNTDDFVPALAGPQLDDHLLQIERQAFGPGSPIPADLPAPAHQRTAYAATAEVIDRATSQAVREQVAAMDAFTADYRERDGSSVTAMTYHAERGGAKGFSPGGSIR